MPLAPNGHWSFRIDVETLLRDEFCPDARARCASTFRALYMNRRFDRPIFDAQISGDTQYKNLWDPNGLLFPKLISARVALGHGMYN